MKRLLLLALTAGLLSPANSKPNQWPTSWKQFKSPPSEMAKPYAVVKFRSSIEEACKEFEKAEKIEKIFEDRHENVVDSYLYTYKDEEEWYEKTDPHWQKLWPKKMQTLAAAVEVLRQANYPDWKLYLRYNIAGVGDLWRTRVLKDKSKVLYGQPGYNYYKHFPRDVRDICSAFKE